MTELRAIVRLINTLDEISDLEATVGGWTVEITNKSWSNTRAITFTRTLPDENETVDDIVTEAEATED